jgi:GT2 family glycosyltransferase
MTEQPSVSVVIPTHNRLAVLRRGLAALAKQSYPLERLEAIVVADGCRDGTEQALRGADFPFSFRLVSQPASGPGAARNRGAAEASGELLVFLDDDMIASARLVEAHVDGHRQLARAGVVLGPSLMAPEPEPTYFGTVLRGWWDDRFRALAQPGYEFTYRDLLSGNFSVPAGLFREIGGFDESFRHAREDGELGARLIAAGAPFRFAPGALAEHQDTADLGHCIRRWRHEGCADVRLARLHPDVWTSLPLARMSSWAVQRVFERPRAGRIAAAGAVPLLRLLEALGLHTRWSRWYGRLYDYWYMRGVADELGSVEALRTLQGSLPTPASGTGVYPGG